MVITKQNLKTIAVIFTVVLMGMGSFDLGLYIMFKSELEVGSCELCFEINPALSECENFKPIDINNFTIVTYEK